MIKRTHCKYMVYTHEAAKLKACLTIHTSSCVCTVTSCTPSVFPAFMICHLTWVKLEPLSSLHTDLPDFIYTTSTGTPLKRTLSNTTASERSENRSSPSLRDANTYTRRVFAQESIPKYILISPASAVYALFVLNTKESKSQDRASHLLWFHLQSCSPFTA